MKFREFFDRTFIINLPERTDRRQEMLGELERAGLSPETGRIEFFPAVRVTEAAGFESAGCYGCFLSHLAVFKQARQAGAAQVLVFEDDAVIVPRFQQDEEALVEQMRSMPWGIAYFGHALEDPADRPAHLKPFNESVRLAHFYSVNGKYLDRLIAFFESILTRPPGHPDGGPMPADGALHFFLMKNSDVPSHVATPNLGTQRFSRSDISPKWFDHVPVLNKAIARLRRVKRWLKRP